jgi:tetratricopeptide (TPR) repeat protein
MRFKSILTAFVILIGYSNNIFCANDKGIEINIPDNNQFNKFGNYIEQSIENGSPSFLNKSFDLDLFMQKIFDRYNPNGQTDFNEGFKKGFMNNFDLGVMIIDEINKNGSYTFLRSYVKDGNNYLLFRLLSENGINYHELEVKLINGEFYITDVFLYHTGEKISETIGHIYESFVQAFSDNDENSSSKANEYMEMQAIKVLSENGYTKKAFKKWQSLPEETRNKKAFLVLGLQLSTGIGNKEFMQVYDEYYRYFPENNSKYLIPVESLVSTKNYQQALICIDNLEKGIVSDPMLNFLRANILFEMGNRVEASNKLNQLIESIPQFEKSYFSLLNIYIKDKSYSKATDLLDKMVINLNYYKGSMSVILDEYPDFCKSKEYQNWINQ